MPLQSDPVLKEFPLIARKSLNTIFKDGVIIRKYYPAFTFPVKVVPYKKCTNWYPKTLVNETNTLLPTRFLSTYTLQKKLYNFKKETCQFP